MTETITNTTATTTTEAIAELADMLTNAYDLAQDIKFNVRAYSRERREMMYVTSALEGILQTILS